MCTLHSLGYQAVRRQYPDVGGVNEHKMDAIVETLIRVRPRTSIALSSLAEVRGQFRRLISLAKATLTDPGHRSAVARLMDRYGINLAADVDTVSTLLDEALDWSLQQRQVVDYDDMIYVPVRLGLPIPRFDAVFVDEALDLNPAQIELVLRSVRSGGRVIAVGDRRQSIYGWRGADTQAIPNLIKRLGATTLPLSISYRCPRHHVRLARRLAPRMKAAPGAVDGIVRTVDEMQLPEIVREGDLIICRTNAPLIVCAFSLLKHNFRAAISGKDMSTNLLSLARRVKADTLHEMHQRLWGWHDEERQRLLDDGASQTRMALHDDRTASLAAIMSHCRTPEDVFKWLNNLYSRGKGAVTLSTVHRAKGLEAERVIILRPDLLPLAVGRTWEKVQERNVKYVALTRSKRELIFAEN